MINKEPLCMLEMSLLKTYWLDAEQHLDRYKYISAQNKHQEYFHDIWELKLFVDLMMAYECILKAIYCNAYEITSTKDIIKTHNINQLTGFLEEHFKSEDEDKRFFYQKFYNYISRINDFLPVFIPKQEFINLRYSCEMLHNTTMYEDYISKIREGNDYTDDLASRNYNDKLYKLLNAIWNDPDIQEQVMMYMY